MTALLLDPHGDDAVLFCCYTAIRERPHVVIANPTVPMEEIRAAMDVLEVTWEVRGGPGKPNLLIAPAYEDAGHDEHNQAASFAGQINGVTKISYLTYAPRGQRSTWGTEVVPTAKEIALKLRALSCFESQIEQASTRPWFFELLDMREWVA